MLNEQYLHGMLLCQEGEELPVDADPDVEAGYAHRYEIEQMESNCES